MRLECRAVLELFYCDHFVLPLPDGHRFPMAKYRLLREAVEKRGLPVEHSLRVPEPVGREDLERVHDPRYVDAVFAGALDERRLRRLGFPWSPQLVERSLRSVGGTLAAARSSLAGAIGINLAGGTHHAFRDRGEGFCVFNDIAVAARALLAGGLTELILVIDCDVHQGDGTASIFAGDDTVRTLSIHGATNYPLKKETSDLDVALPDGTGDAEYLEALERGLDVALDWGPFDLAFYLAGADPYEGDRFGRLGLTADGLAARDQSVYRWTHRQGLPVATVMGGGYAADETVIATLHYRTLERAALVLATG
jgi:acetoin utilization deacetylase AcuC-like enzyme